MNEWTEAEEHAQRGRQLYEAGQWDRALDELRLAVQRNPYQADWHYGMGLILDAMGRGREAAQAFEQALQLRGEDAETLMRLGINLVRCDQPRRAADMLARASRLDPELEQVYCYRILAHARLGQHEAAEVAFYLGRQIEDECPRCYDHLAESLAARGELKRAIWCWQQTLRLHRTAIDVHRKLADAHWRLGQHEHARRELLAYLRIRPRDLDVLMQLGRLLRLMHRYADATERFHQIVAIDPTCAAAYHELGELSLTIGHLDAAEQQLRRAQQIEPNRPGTRRLLADIARRRGRLEDCRYLLSQEALRRQADAEQVLALARLMLDVNMAADATALLTDQFAPRAVPGLSAPADRATGLIYRGVARLLSGELDAGIRDCRASLRDAPGHPAALQNLVLANLEAGRLRWRLWRQRLAQWWPRPR